MNVFVTGASGFIGQVIVRNLLKTGHSVTALLLPQEPESLSGGAAIIRGDITRPETLFGAMKSAQAVIHIAGSVGFQTWKNCLAINRDGTANVVREAANSGVRRFIQMSSVAVYGRTPGVPIREDFRVKKIGDPYGDTKIDGESLVQEQARLGKLDLTIIRPTVVYGPGDDKFLPTLLQSLRSDRFRFFGDGEQTVDLIHVDDVAAFVLRVLEEPRSIGKIYNLTNLKNPSWNEMVQMVTSELGLPMPERHLAYSTAYRLAGIMEFLSHLTGKPPRLSRYSVRVVGRPYHYLIDAARQDLNFTPSIDLLAGLKECLKTAMPEKSAS
jgi:nucleoside-diphosphate-sugar epimerase